MLKTMGWGLIVVLAVSAGCRKADQAGTPPNQQKYEVKLESGGSMKASAAPVDVSVMSEGKPIADAEVALEMRMPASASMGEMRTGANLKNAGDGHYRGQVDLGMSGKWTAIVRVTRGGQLVSTYSQPVDGVE